MIRDPGGGTGHKAALEEGRFFPRGIACSVLCLPLLELEFGVLSFRAVCTCVGVHACGCWFSRMPHCIEWGLLPRKWARKIAGGCRTRWEIALNSVDVYPGASFSVFSMAIAYKYMCNEPLLLAGCAYEKRLPMLASPRNV